MKRMKLVEDRKDSYKTFIYDCYTRIVYNCKYYDNITRTKMLEEIIKQYKLPHFMYNILSTKELDFIKKFYKKKLKESDIKKYNWEIKTLTKKLLFDYRSRSFYEEFDEVIPSVIEEYNNSTVTENELKGAMILVGFIRMYGEFLTQAAYSIMSYFMPNMTEKDFDLFLGCPLIHYYLDYDYIEIFGKEEETIYYRDYEEYLDEFREEKKKYTVNNTIDMNLNKIEEFFYYGFNISDANVKKMYDYYMKNHPYLIRAIEISRLLGKIRYNRLPQRILDILSKDEKVVEGLGATPCAAMNGQTPREYLKNLKEDQELSEKMVSIPQNNAHVHKDVKEKFYKYHMALLEYINNKHKININIKNIYKQTELNPKDIYEIDDYLWKHKEEIDNFINENPFKFNKKELKEVEQFKTALEDSLFIFLGTDKEYAKFFSKDGKIYMVKGLNCDIDKILDCKNIPRMVDTHLLMFEGYIIYNGMIGETSIDLGLDFKKTVLKEIKNAVKYYHF